MTATGQPNSDEKSPRRIIVGLIIALAAWGIYLAIGATGQWTDVGLFDARRSAIVLACSALFLGTWVVVLVLRSKSGNASVSNPGPSWASILSLGGTLASYVMWAVAHAVWQGGQGERWTKLLGWSCVVFFGSSAILALIGLSDPKPRRGKMLGLASMLLLLLSVVLFVWQVNHYLAR
ncbi:MAG: hypothetical protein P8N76_03000 [Pirellulaceae bacterium]|nr:hypothetical protein [Pirellulaceae bacterium]